MWDYDVVNNRTTPMWDVGRVIRSCPAIDYAQIAVDKEIKNTVAKFIWWGIIKLSYWNIVYPLNKIWLGANSRIKATTNYNFPKLLILIDLMHEDSKKLFRIYLTAWIFWW